MTQQETAREYIVSGGRHVVSLGEFRGIRIVTVSEMLGSLEEVWVMTCCTNVFKILELRISKG